MENKMFKVLAIVMAVALVLILALVIVFAARGCGSSSDSGQSSSTQSQSSTSSKSSNSSTSSSTKTSVDADDQYATGTHHAVVTVEGYDSFTIELDADDAPITVSNFCSLANSGFYDGLTFHRIVESFCLQGGDPSGNGTGSSSTTIKGEFSDNGVTNTLADNYKRGVVAMARSSANDSASCQWFITLADSAATSLNGKYAAFGTIDNAGMAIVDQIVSDYASKATGSSGTISSTADQPVITSIKITD